MKKQLGKKRTEEICCTQFTQFQLTKKIQGKTKFDVVKKKT
jgi:hypothetical protein